MEQLLYVVGQLVTPLPFYFGLSTGVVAGAWIPPLSVMLLLPAFSSYIHKSFGLAREGVGRGVVWDAMTRLFEKGFVPQELSLRKRVKHRSPRRWQLACCISPSTGNMRETREWNVRAECL